MPLPRKVMGVGGQGVALPAWLNDEGVGGRDPFIDGVRPRTLPGGLNAVWCAFAEPGPAPPTDPALECLCRLAGAR